MSWAVPSEDGGFGEEDVGRPRLAGALRDYYGRLRACYLALYRAWHARERGREPRDLSAVRVPRWDGGTDADGRRWRPVWPALVRFGAGHDCDPFELLRALFHAWRGNHPPQPAMAMSAWAVDRCREYRAEFGADLAARYDALRSRLASEVSAYVKVGRYRSVGHALEALLLDTGEYPPLLAFCALAGAGRPDLAGRLLLPAAFEYLRSPREYDSVLRGHLPDDLREFALEELVRQLREDSHAQPPGTPGTP